MAKANGPSQIVIIIPWFLANEASSVERVKEQVHHKTTKNHKCTSARSQSKLSNPTNHWSITAPSKKTIKTQNQTDQLVS